MVEAVEGSPSESTLSLACFEVGGALYALEVGSLREIVRPLPITPLPGAPASIEGVTELRGSLLVVVDLARLLGRDAAGDGPRTRIVVLEVDGLAFGLRVDAAVDVLGIAADRLEEVPALARPGAHGSVRRALRRPGQAPVLVLCARGLIEAIDRSPGVLASPPPTRTEREARS
jgi:purine-binding chemotaxis protein CheW